MSWDFSIYGFNETELRQLLKKKLVELNIPETEQAKIIAEMNEDITTEKLYDMIDRIYDTGIDEEVRTEEFGVRQLVHLRNKSINYSLHQLFCAYNEGEFEDTEPTGGEKFKVHELGLVISKAEIMDLLDWIIAVSYEMSDEEDLFIINPDKYKKEAKKAFLEYKDSADFELFGDQLMTFFDWKMTVRNSPYEKFYWENSV